MNFRRRRKMESEVYTHSLSDIMFFLLLFFLITSTMVNPNIMKLMLPKAPKEKKVSTPKNINVNIDAQGNYSFNKQPVALENLQTRLQTELTGIQEPVIVIAADEKASWGSVVKVMSIGRKLNAKVLAATQVEK